MTLPQFLGGTNDEGFVALAEHLKDPVHRATIVYQLELLLQKGHIELRTNHLMANKFFSDYELGAISSHDASRTYAYYQPRFGIVDASRHQLTRRGLRLKYPILPCLAVFGGVVGYGKAARRTQRRNGRSPPMVKKRHRYEFPLELITVQETTPGVFEKFAYTSLNRGTSAAVTIGTMTDTNAVEETPADQEQIEVLHEDDNESTTSIANGGPIQMLFALLLWLFGITSCVTDQEASPSVHNEEVAEPAAVDPVENDDWFEGNGGWDAETAAAEQNDVDQTWGERNDGWDSPAVEEPPAASRPASSSFPSCPRPASPQQLQELERRNPTRPSSNRSHRSAESSRQVISNNAPRDPFNGPGFGASSASTNQVTSSRQRRSPSYRQTTRGHFNNGGFGRSGFGNPQTPSNIQYRPPSPRFGQRSPSPQTSRGGFGNRRNYPEHSITRTGTAGARHRIQISGPSEDVRQFLTQLSQLCRSYEEQIGSQ